MMTTQLHDRLRQWDEAYYNQTGEEEKDDVYDAVRDFVEKNQEYPYIGAPPPSRIIQQQTLPFYMGSLEKIRSGEEARFSRWLSASSSSGNDFILEPKLDGVSALWDSSQKRLYTRGNGREGTDISHLARHLGLLSTKRIEGCVRGELVIRAKCFQENYTLMYKSPRHLVSGIVNALPSTLDPTLLKDLEFVVYEWLSSPPPCVCPLQQLRVLRKHGFRVVDHQVVQRKHMTLPYLGDMFQHDPLVSTYVCDGLVILHNKEYTPVCDRNPVHAIAFKPPNPCVIARVVAVEWNRSRYDRLKPRIRIDPVKIDGVVITYLTGFHAKYIESNRIGPGAVLEIVRSGGVIPHIRNIVIPASHPQFPTCPYQWESVDLVVVEERSSRKEALDQELEPPQTVFFCKTLGIRGIGEKTAMCLKEHGVSSLRSLWETEMPRFQEILGQKEGAKIYQAIHDTTRQVSLARLMAISGVFPRGFGEKKFSILLAHVPEFMDSPKTMIAETPIPGWPKESILQILKYREAFRPVDEFFRTRFHQMEQQHQKQSTKGVVVCTGFRDASLSQMMERLGYTLKENVSKDTILVIRRDEDFESTKVRQAIEKGIQVVTRDEAIRIYQK